MTKNAHNFIDLTGKRYGSWTVESFAGKTTNQQSLWNCVCSCGRRKAVYSTNLVGSKSTSCRKCSGKRTALKLRRGKYLFPDEYAVWQHMKKRCLNPKTPGYHNYGGRGIKVCDRWLHSFDNFVEDMGAKPSPEHQIERENNDGDYHPDNCVWATAVEQGRNKRSNTLGTYGGTTMCLSAWEERMGFPRGTISHRMASGWTFEKAVSTPLRRCRRGR